MNKTTTREPEASHEAKSATTWACLTIAKFAPHFTLKALRGGLWAIHWLKDDGSAGPEFDVSPVDWRGLCRFATSVQEDRNRKLQEVRA